MALSSVSVRISPELYNEIRAVADKEGITFIEAADHFIVGYEGEIAKLQKEIAKLKEEVASENTQLKEEKARLESENVQLKEIKAKLESENARLRETKKQLEDENKNKEADLELYDEIDNVKQGIIDAYQDFVKETDKYMEEHGKIIKTVWYKAWNKRTERTKPLLDKLHEIYGE